MNPLHDLFLNEIPYDSTLGTFMLVVGVLAFLTLPYLLLRILQDFRRKKLNLFSWLMPGSVLFFIACIHMNLQTPRIEFLNATTSLMGWGVIALGIETLFILPCSINRCMKDFKNEWSTKDNWVAIGAILGFFTVICFSLNFVQMGWTTGIEVLGRGWLLAYLAGHIIGLGFIDYGRNRSQTPTWVLILYLLAIHLSTLACLVAIPFLVLYRH